MSFDKQIARKDIIEGLISPHDERFTKSFHLRTRYNYFIKHYFRLPDVSFDKMSIRKGTALNSGATNLDYDYKDALEKCKYDLSIKRVLPF